MAGLYKQIWINQLMQGFYPDTSFLNFARNFSTLVNNDKIHLAEAGVDPEVLVNNTTYPIAITQRIDKPIEIQLDKFETENTLVRRPEAIQYAYDQLDSVLRGHRESLRTKTGEKAAHAFAPNGDSEFTPVIKTTGADNGDGYKRLKIEDILLLKRRYDNKDIPLEGRYLVLHPNHIEDLILIDLDAFKDITDFKEGKPMKIAGFNILQYSKTPQFTIDATTGVATKVAFGAVSGPNDTFSSFSFHKDEVMKADGEVYMYMDEDNPKERGTIVGFDKRFIALPIRNKAIGAIIAGKV